MEYNITANFDRVGIKFINDAASQRLHNFFHKLMFDKFHARPVIAVVYLINDVWVNLVLKNKQKQFFN